MMATLFILMSLMTLMGCHGDSMTLPLEDCRSMVPPDHGKLAQTTTAPYEISFSDNCYKTGLSLRVTLAGTNGSVFTSFLVQARKPNNDSFSYGTFSSASGDDPEIDTIDCFNQSASAIGHYNETGYNFTRAAFNWTAPADVNIDVLEFVASVILDKETFWTGLSSPIARCNDNRDNSSLSENNEMTSESTDAAAQTTTTTTTTETQPATTETTTTEIPPATTATTTTATEAPPATTATTTTTEIPPAATATMTTATEAPQATTATMTTATEASQATTEATAIGNFTIATDGTGNGTGYTWSTVAATATSTNESHTVAITTTSMNNQTTSGADRRKESMASLAFYVAFVASLALIHQQQLAYL